VADITALRNGFAELNIEKQEFILADKGYQGHNKCLTPFKGSGLSNSEEAFNEVLASVRILVECVIGRLKIFGVLGGKGRFHKSSFLHKLVFNVCCQITNISMMREPVWLNINRYLL
jgi:hypothetical protein